MIPLLHVQTGKQLERFIADPAHALALHGEQGSGKGYLAQYIAAQLLDVAVEKIIDHPYVMRLNAAQTKIGIEEVRGIQSFLLLKVPGHATVRRVVILESIDLYGHEAQNALLKTLEEPPNDTVIIVTIAQTQAVLPTIHSRAQPIQVIPVDLELAIDYFGQQFSKEIITKSMYMSGGLPGLLVALLDNSTEHPLVNAIEQARLLITMTRYQRLTQIDKLLKNKDLQPILLLDGLYRLIDAGYRQAVSSKSNDQLQSTITRLTLLEQALNDLRSNVQAKIVLNRLFLEF